MDAEPIVLPKFRDDRLHFCVRTCDAILLSLGYVGMLYRHSLASEDGLDYNRMMRFSRVNLAGRACCCCMRMIAGYWGHWPKR
jgi:hypothetical protein